MTGRGLYRAAYMQVSAGSAQVRIASAVHAIRAADAAGAMIVGRQKKSDASASQERVPARKPRFREREPGNWCKRRDRESTGCGGVGGAGGGGPAPPPGRALAR